MSDFKFFRNENCKYFPCHDGIDPEQFNCLFCYCPLYALGRNCGGNFRYTKKGIKDCSNCTIPHQKDNYDKMVEKAKVLVEMVREKKDDE